MIKIFSLFFSFVVFLQGSLALQNALMGGSDLWLSQGSHSISKCFTTPPKRFFSSTLPHHSKKIEVFSRPTCDRIAKHILSEDESVRVSILRAFTGIKTLSSAKQIDEYYNPFDILHNLRKLVNSEPTKSLFGKIRNSLEVELSLDGKKNEQASEILKGLSDLYDDLSRVLPRYRNRSTVDFLCETAFGYTTIEFQVDKQDYLDKRALAYIASIYSNQLRPNLNLDDKDINYKKLQNVIGINLLGDGSLPYWKDGRFIRDYTFVDQRGSGHTISSMRLIQYSLGDADLTHKDLKDNTELKQWIDFFKSAHEKDSIPSTVDESVKKAYSMIKVDTLKKEHPDLLEDSGEFFASLTDLTEHDQAVQRVAKSLARKGMDSKEIAELTGLSELEILKFKNQSNK